MRELRNVRVYAKFGKGLRPWYDSLYEYVCYVGRRFECRRCSLFGWLVVVLTDYLLFLILTLVGLLPNCVPFILWLILGSNTNKLRNLHIV
jgi:hypothetical protein